MQTIASSATMIAEKADVIDFAMFAYRGMALKLPPQGSSWSAATLGLPPQ
ncbi:MAG: hypothetical protein JWQ87_2146 [Candidatus Sulfotelmatobacter sp.]|nr:hypothetical protein [Candidatus Sulfotelmatobacter sp.]